MTSHQAQPQLLCQSKARMLDLRGKIYNLSNLKDELQQLEDGDEGKTAVADLLRAKFPGDGRTLLMYAALWGRETQFRSLFDETRRRIGAVGLATQLRRSDANGAPLLLQAASTSGSCECFEAVHDLIDSTLGKGGIIEQARAVDSEGKTLIMYAARRSNDDVYKCVKRLLKNLAIAQQPLWDNRERTVLHHAAEAGSLELLRAVIQNESGTSELPEEDNAAVDKPNNCTAADSKVEEDDQAERKDCESKGQEEPKAEREESKTAEASSMCSKTRGYNCFAKKTKVDEREPTPRASGETRTQDTSTRDSLTEALRATDREGRSPLMYLLAKGYSSEGENNEDVLKDKMALLLEEMSDDDKGRLDLLLPGTSGDHTALTHAARGGQAVFDLACSKIVELRKNLGRTSASKAQLLLEQNIKMLVVQAALGGHAPLIKALLEHESATTSEGAQGCDTRRIGADTLYTISPRDAGAAREASSAGNAADSVDPLEESLFVLTILSGNVDAVNYSAGFIKRGTDENTRWDILRGKKGLRSLTYAALSTPTAAEKSGTEVFEAVYEILKNVAKGTSKEQDGVVPKPSAISCDDQHRPSHEKPEEKVKRCLDEEFLLTRKSERALTPLAGAALRGNPKLFNTVLSTYEKYSGQKWPRRQIVDQLLGALRENDKRVIPQDVGKVPSVPAVMLHHVVKAIVNATDKDESGWKVDWDMREAMEHGVKEAIERGDSEAVRGLKEVGFRLELQGVRVLSILLTSIGDHEKSVIDFVMSMVTNASNPFVMCTIASRAISNAMFDMPVPRKGLRVLQTDLDALRVELLDKLPHTVRRVGRELLRNHPSHARDKGRMANLVGYIVVRRMLEPSLDPGVEDGCSSPEPSEDNDPLQRALERGSDALGFLHTPLVLDYVLLKFSSTLPNWMALNPFRFHINEGFYLYETGEKHQEALKRCSWVSLLRMLQGWDGDSKMKPGEVRTGFPLRTLLPGLQFVLAGIVGKPDTFFTVPAIRFSYEILSYMTMLGLFLACDPIEDSDQIPVTEILFYVFAVGILWREITEFRGCLPPRSIPLSKVSHVTPSTQQDSTQDGPSGRRCDGLGDKIKRFTCARTRSRPQRRVATALSRYLFQDTWNILDTATIILVLVAFVFRLLGLQGHWSSEDFNDVSNATGSFKQEAFFIARFCLSAIAPLLVARLLFLSQIHDTLGPMTQIIWTMLSHLGRFSVFLLVIMAGFAMTLRSLYFDCEGELIGGMFDTFHSSLLVLFQAMLGDFDFSIFDDAVSACPGPDWALPFGSMLLAMYMVVMAILLMNLLIAVLGTVHAEVYAKAEMEFQLSRTKLIHKTAATVAHGRLPPPLNVVMVLLGFMVDTCGGLYRMLSVWRKDSDKFRTWSSRKRWRVFEAVLQRLLFAASMGVFAAAMSILLWLVSLPWVACHMLRWCFPLETTESEENAWQIGYAKPFFDFVAKVLGCLVALVFAFLYVVFCLVCTVALWFRGIKSVWDYFLWGLKKENTYFDERKPCAVMPGEECRGDWKYVKELAEEHNYRDPGSDSRHFHVAPLLKMTTGLDMEHHATLIRRRKEEEMRKTFKLP